MSYKPRKETLEKVLQYLDSQLHLPLSLDDALYAKFRAQQEILKRERDEIYRKGFNDGSHGCRWQDGLVTDDYFRQ